MSTPRLPADAAAAAEAIRVLRGGGVVAAPTDTVYGLLASAADRAAVERVYRIKNRPPNKPMIHLIASREWLSFFGDPAVPRRFLDLWPGPLTLVVRNTNRDLPAAGETAAVRWPDHPFLLEILGGVGEPLVAPSANRSGLPPAASADEIEEIFPDGVDLLLDGGAIPAGTPSTIVDVTGPEPKVLRRGRLPLP